MFDGGFLFAALLLGEAIASGRCCIATRSSSDNSVNRSEAAFISFATEGTKFALHWAMAMPLLFATEWQHSLAPGLQPGVFPKTLFTPEGWEDLALRFFSSR
ncbi:MAG: hypothetical protein ACI97B_002282 [Verrucomicrobiales bacterium]